MADESRSIPVRKPVSSSGGPEKAPASLPTPVHPAQSYRPPARDHRIPLIDIYDTADGLVLEADLPGASEQSLTIHLEHNVLSLRAATAPPPAPGAQLIQQEYPLGDFDRSFILSDDIDRSLVSAELKHGVLRVWLPRAERSVTRRIDVRGE
jgi:HSP20 family molecular chaperone IbpA